MDVRKQCPACRQISAIHEMVCAGCGHRFRTRFDVPRATPRWGWLQFGFGALVGLAVTTLAVVTLMGRPPVPTRAAPAAIKAAAQEQVNPEDIAPCGHLWLFDGQCMVGHLFIKREGAWVPAETQRERQRALVMPRAYFEHLRVGGKIEDLVPTRGARVPAPRRGGRD